MNQPSCPCLNRMHASNHSRLILATRYALAQALRSFSGSQPPDASDSRFALPMPFSMNFHRSPRMFVSYPWLPSLLELQIVLSRQPQILGRGSWILLFALRRKKGRDTAPVRLQNNRSVIDRVQNWLGNRETKRHMKRKPRDERKVRRTTDDLTYQTTEGLST
jgi:hypothetical protein